MNKRITAGTGASLGALLALPAVAQADDFTVTNLTDDGAGSLRQAVTDANDTAEADRIVFKSKLSGTIELTEGAVYPQYGDLEIVGPGARKLAVRSDGTAVFGAIANFDGRPPIDVSISGLTIADGEGGGLFGALVGNYTGGVGTYGDVDLTLSKVTISGNTSPEDGGGISVIQGPGTPGLTIENSTISGNAAGDDGGGISFEDGDLTITNSTVSGNSSAGDGGGVALSSVEFGDAEIRNTTVTRNTAAESGGGFWENVDGASLHGVIAAGNSAAINADDVEGDPWEASFSLIGTDGDPGITDQGGNIFNVDPKLKPLKNNGGPTDTHAFKKSPAKNKGPSDAPNSDQRGAPRKGKPDIGAYEFTKCEGVVVNRVGTAGKDKLKGTKKKDGMLGLGGNDKLAGKKGKDGLCGGSGKDKLKGGPGKDKLNGGPGKDKEVQ